VIQIVPYDPEWPRAFEVEAYRLRAALKALARRIDHHGSTAIPGVSAKPIIDIQVSVASLRPLLVYGSPLETLGYVHVPHADDDRCPFFHTPAVWPHSHHVHVVQWKGLEERRTLAFRDFLRDHPAVVVEYEDLKRQLAASLAADDVTSREEYAAGKTPFVERIVALAMAAGYPRDFYET
jgi:GrpB-like predicted nucleotidyltransferase (UPF0157 family)